MSAYGHHQTGDSWNPPVTDLAPFHPSLDQSFAVHVSSGLVSRRCQNSSARAFPSTRSHRVPHGEIQYVLCGVPVPVMNRATFTYPVTHRQRHRLLYQPTRRASLARRSESVHGLDNPTMPCGLVFELPPQFSHADIADGLRQTTVPHHASHMQVLNRQESVISNQLRAELVQPVPATIGNAGMQHGNYQSLPVPPAASLRPARQDALGMFQPSQQSTQVPWVAGLPSIGRNHDILHAKVNPDRIGFLRPLVDFLFDGEGREVAPEGILCDRDHLWHATGDSGPDDLKLSEFRKLEHFTSPVQADRNALVYLVAHALGVRTLFEFRVLGALGEEIDKGTVLVSEFLHQRPTADFVQPSIRFELFELSQFTREVHGRYLLAAPIGIRAPRKTDVPYPAGTAEFPREPCALVRCRVDSESISNLHIYSMTDKHKILQARVTEDIWRSVNAAAAECGLSVTAWMTMTLKREAAKTGRMPTKAAGRPAPGAQVSDAPRTGSSRRGRGRP